MRKTIALLMTAVMALATPASVLAEEWDDVIISEETYEGQAEEAAYEEPFEEADYGIIASEIVIEDDVQDEEVDPSAEENLEVKAEPLPEEVPIQDADAEIVIDTIEEDPVETYSVSSSKVVTLSEVASGTSGNGHPWVLDDAGTLTISGTGDMAGYIGGSAPWYPYRELIVSIVIEEGITYIGSGTFVDCQNLTSVTLPEGITGIGNYAFEDCSSLTSITLPEGMTSINMGAFSDCSSLTSVSIPSSMTSIGNYAFDGCSSLTDVYYNGTKSEWGKISIGDYNDALLNATIHCSDGTVITNLSVCTVTISPTNYTYDGTAKKPSVTVKNGSTTLTNGTDYTVSYSNNTDAGTATVTVTGKGNYTGTVTKSFTINKASQNVTAKAAASSIEVGKTTTITASGKGTISYSSSNTSVATVSSKGVVTGIAEGAVTITVKAAGNSNYKSGSTTVKIKVVLKKGSSYTSGDFVYKILTLPSSGKGTVRLISPAKSSIKKAAIPAKVTIGGRVFKVTEIGAKAFKGCKKLTTVSTGKNVTVIGNQAFQGCTSMTGVSIQVSTTTIGKKAFYNCQELKKIVIKSKQLTSVGKNAFKGTKANAQIKVPKSKLKAYKKLLKGKGLGKNVTITS